MGFHKFCQGSMGSARVWYLYGLHTRVGNLQHFLRYYNDASIIPKVNLHNVWGTTPASPPCCRCTFCLTLQAVCSYMAGMFNTPEDTRAVPFPSSQTSSRSRLPWRDTRAVLCPWSQTSTIHSQTLQACFGPLKPRV